MAFMLPNFNMQYGVWWNYDPLVSDYGSPDLKPNGNLTPGKRVMQAFSGEQWDFEGVLVYGNPMELLCEAGEDIRCKTDVENWSMIEAPFHSGRLYVVVYVDDIGKTFANEHRYVLMHRVAQAVVFTADTIPVPVPLP